MRRGRARKLCEGTDYEFAKSWAERREQEIRSSDALDHMRALAVRKTSACLSIRFVLLLLEEVVRHVPSEKNFRSRLQKLVLEAVELTATKS